MGGHSERVQTGSPEFAVSDLTVYSGEQKLLIGLNSLSRISAFESLLRAKTPHRCSPESQPIQVEEIRGSKHPRMLREISRFLSRER